jgi:hypothetical protein
MEINNITLGHLYKNYKKTIHLLIYRRRKLYLFFNVMMQVRRNHQVLSEKAGDSSAFLNAMFLLKYVLN